MPRTAKTLKPARDEAASVPVSFRLTPSELEALDALVKKAKGESRSSIAKQALLDRMTASVSPSPSRGEFEDFEKEMAARIEHAVRETAKTSLAVTHKSVRQLEEQIAMLTRVVQDLATRV